MKLLLARNVSVHVVDKSGWTPLLWAASGGHAEVSSRLPAIAAVQVLSSSSGTGCLLASMQ